MTTVSTGAVYNRSGFSVTINASINGANGLDTGTLTTSSWYYVWGIDNGTAAAGLMILSSTSPILPSGYTAQCRLGAVVTDGSSNLMRTLQLGNQAQYEVTAATNTATLPQLKTALTGNVNTPTFTTVAIGAYIPPTATVGNFQVATASGGAAVPVEVILAPNANYAGATSSSNPPPIMVCCGGDDVGGTYVNVGGVFPLVLESTNVYYAAMGGSGGASGAAVLAVFGWKDSVNAN